MTLILVQLLSGLANASSLFLVASGLSLIFGVTRIVNFAHGAFYMLGAYGAYSLTSRFDGALGFWAGILLAALCVAGVGAVVEIALLRRIYRAPQLLQLLATFGLTLMAEDGAVLIWGSEDLVGPRAPGLTGAIDIWGTPLPSYDLFLLILGPVVLGLLWLLLHRTRWGILLRAATQDRDMVAALGIDQKWLFTGVFTLGVLLAALGGGLQLPRDAVSHQMDLSIIVEVFVVVVIGGLGSITGAFLASVLVCELNAFGILLLPGITLVLMFLVMALLLVVRPWGLLGRPLQIARTLVGAAGITWAPLGQRAQTLLLLAVAGAALLPFLVGPYWLTVGAEILIFVIFALSLQFILSGGGLESFGHAAYFGLGAYGAALGVKWLGLGMGAALLAGPLAATAGALLFGWFCVRLSGVYLAMLTLAVSQILWSVAFQWVALTGGDNGILGVWPAAWAASPAPFYWLTLALAMLSAALLRHLTLSPLGYALRALRDSGPRAAAIGIRRQAVQYVCFAIAAGFAGLAGALFAFLKGSVFPDVLGVSRSIDALVMVLLGGIGTLSGSVVGAIVYKAASIWLVSRTDLSNLCIGAMIVLLVVTFPRGIVGTLAQWRRTDWRPGTELGSGGPRQPRTPP